MRIDLLQIIGVTAILSTRNVISSFEFNKIEDVGAITSQQPEVEQFIVSFNGDQQKIDLNEKLKLPNQRRLHEEGYVNVEPVAHHFTEGAQIPSDTQCTTHWSCICDGNTGLGTKSSIKLEPDHGSNGYGTTFTSNSNFHRNLHEIDGIPVTVVSSSIDEAEEDVETTHEVNIQTSTRASSSSSKSSLSTLSSQSSSSSVDMEELLNEQ